MEWEIYKNERKRARTKQYISITKGRTFGLPRAFIDKYDLSSGLKAVILFNPTQKKIALRFTDKNPAFGYTVRVSNNPKHGGWIAAKSFFDDKEIDVVKFAGHYDFQKSDLRSLGINSEGDVFVIDIAEKNPSLPHQSKLTNNVEEVGNDNTDPGF